uniref:Cathepsin L1 n=1 Tax=Eudiplozoon nipponicum TaxID=116851 RepID=A0A0K1L8K1_EUDNI|nr:cathepsin L1 [Eudiplozoon nipponicum]
MAGQDHWASFKSQHAKNYDDEEDTTRRTIFETNLAAVEHHNALFNTGRADYSLALNHLSDWKDHELLCLRGHRADLKTESRGSAFIPNACPFELPERVDWRDKGLVTPVKNQGQCGSCWAFSTTGSLEGQHFRKTGKLLSLSEQQLVDCSSAFGNHGCNGGLFDFAFKYVQDSGGITTEDLYPYVSGVIQKAHDVCSYNPDMCKATCTGWVDIPSKDSKALMYAVATIGPISIAINAMGPGFMQYKSGIYNPPSCPGDFSDLDHAVLLVGYGTQNGLNYWIVKNSWSEKWGENGYVRICRDGRNLCGVATCASYPLV